MRRLFFPALIAVVVTSLVSAAEPTAYPFPPKEHPFSSQGLPLLMTYMDVAPAGPVHGTVMLLHGKNFSGTYFETCNCEVACPCVFLGSPSSADCTVLIAWHIDQGGFGDTKLDGLNAVLAVHSPGHMLKTKWQVALYLDQRASPPQAEALGKIFSGQAAKSNYFEKYWETPLSTGCNVSSGANFNLVGRRMS